MEVMGTPIRAADADRLLGVHRRVRPAGAGRDAALRRLLAAGDAAAVIVALTVALMLPQTPAAETNNRGRGIEAKQLGCERTGVKIARRLAARDHHAHGRSAWLVENRWIDGHIELETSHRPRTAGAPSRRTSVVNATFSPCTSR